MTKKEFFRFQVSLNLNIEIDTYLRGITEKIKLLSQTRDEESLRDVCALLGQVNRDIDERIMFDLSDEE